MAAKEKKVPIYIHRNSIMEATDDSNIPIAEIDKMLFPKTNLWTLVSCGEWSTLNIVKTAD